MSRKGDPPHTHLRLEDIARLSGVSRSTVSRVINQHPNVSAKTQRKVLAAIEQYNYQPNLAARALVTQKLNVIGILIPHIVSDVFSDPFFALLLQSITATANQLNYGVTLWLTSTENGTNTLDRVLNNRLLDGLIVASAVVDKQFLGKLEERHRPYLLVGHPDPAAGASFVDVENEVGGQVLTEHLINQGYRRIGFIPGRKELASSQDREQGYTKALTEANLPVIIGPAGNFTEAGGYEAMQSLLPRDVDAVFCASDLMAIGALRAIKEVGLCTPDDIAVGGFDDMQLAKTTDPPLTTIRQSIDRLGEVAAEGIIDILENSEKTLFQRILPVELVIRNST